MDESFKEEIKRMVFGYLRGDRSIPELYEWANAQNQFASSIPHIREKADIIFFLINEAGLETSNFYTDEKIIITREGISKNLKRCLTKKIAAEDLFNWADDVWNWEITEGYEDEIASSLIERLTEGASLIASLTDQDFENLINHLEKSRDTIASLKAFDEIFEGHGTN